MVFTSSVGQIGILQFHDNKLERTSISGIHYGERLIAVYRKHLLWLAMLVSFGLGKGKVRFTEAYARRIMLPEFQQYFTTSSIKRLLVMPDKKKIAVLFPTAIVIVDLTKPDNEACVKTIDIDFPGFDPALTDVLANNQLVCITTREDDSTIHVLDISKDEGQECIFSDVINTKKIFGLAVLDDCISVYSNFYSADAQRSPNISLEIDMPQTQKKICLRHFNVTYNPDNLIKLPSNRLALVSTFGMAIYDFNPEAINNELLHFYTTEEIADAVPLPGGQLFVTYKHRHFAELFNFEELKPTPELEAPGIAPPGL